MNVSQQVAAERAKIVQKSLSAAENSKSVLLETNLALIDYYRAQGIVLLGDGVVGDQVRRSGAMWSAPEGPATSALGDTVFHTEATDISFRAARALLGKEQAEIAELSNIGVDAVKGLERGRDAGRSYAILRGWYEEQGVVFTGWGDIATRRFYGVGVRWKS
ncbi:XRE family transcriptional regulator [Rhizobium ruizarguesonis]